MPKKGSPRLRIRKTENAPSEPDTEKVKDYRHEEKRPNNPPAGLATYDKTLSSRKVYDYDPHLDLQLVWAGKKQMSLEVENVALQRSRKSPRRFALLPGHRPKEAAWNAGRISPTDGSGMARFMPPSRFARSSWKRQRRF